MLDVTFVAHHLNESLGFGMDRYTFQLMRCLKERGLKVRTISSPSIFISPIKSGIDFFLYLPLLSILSLPSTKLYHFAAPQAGFIIPILKRFSKKRIVTTIYDVSPVLFSKYVTGAGLVGRALGIAIQESDSIIAISSQTKRDILQCFKVDGKKIRVIPLGTDPKFKPLKRANNEAFTVGYIGNFAVNKNVPFLLKGFAQFEKRSSSPVKLVLYGKGAQYKECMELAERLGIRNCEFCGFADEKDIARIFNSFDLFVFPAFTEGFGLPILEAQKCHVPTIVLNEGRIPEEVTKFCLKAKDEAHLAQLMEKVRSEGFRFSKEHLEHLARFTWENCAKQTIEVYEQALKS